MNKRSRPFILSLAVVLFASLAMQACVTTISELRKAKEHAASGDFAWIAAREITCAENSEGCEQLHLLKGDACYRLAKEGKEPLKHYPCAVQHLEAGILQTKQRQTGPSDLNLPQIYTNLCESLRNWRDLTSGTDADRINERLLNNGRAFLAAEPGAPCGVYFINNARYAQLRPRLLHPEQFPALCDDLDAMLRSLGEGPSTASGPTCGPQLQEIKKEVTKAKAIVRCP